MTRMTWIETSRGKIKTPIVFPVHNLGAMAGWNTPRYWDIFPEINVAMFNAYTLSFNRRNILKKLFRSGIHQFLDFNGIAFVDSGGFKVASENFDPDPVKILKLQERIGADIASTLDYPISFIKSPEKQNKYIKKTVANAIKSIKNKSREDMLLFASVHASDPTTLKNVLRYLNDVADFDGFAIGSLMPSRTNYRLLIDMILAAKTVVRDKPLHVYGLGGPLYVPLLAFLGVDSTDSSSFIICAGNRRYFVPGYKVVYLQELVKLKELPCNCPICSNKTVEEIRKDRNLIALHNLWALWFELKQVRFAMMRGKLLQYLETRYSDAPFMKIVLEYAKRKIKNLI